MHPPGLAQKSCIALCCIGWRPALEGIYILWDSFSYHIYTESLWCRWGSVFSSSAVLVQPGLVQQGTSAHKDETPQRDKQQSEGVLVQGMPFLEVAASLAVTPQRVTAARREAVQLLAAGALPAVSQDAESPWAAGNGRARSQINRRRLVYKGAWG